MRPLVLLAALLLTTGCRSTDPYPVPDVPPGATALVLSDDELPRTVYASAWGAFAAAGWEVVGSEPETLRLSVRPAGNDAVLELLVEADVEDGRVASSQAVAHSESHAVLEAAAAVLATVPGHLTVR